MTMMYVTVVAVPMKYKVKVNIRFYWHVTNCTMYIAKATISHSKKIVLFYCVYIYIYINNNLEVLHNNIYGRINLS